MLHYYGVILHALMFTFTYCHPLSTYSIYSLASYPPILDYTLYFVQYYVVREFFEEFYIYMYIYQGRIKLFGAPSQ